jgi:hypothetical protein
MQIRSQLKQQLESALKGQGFGSFATATHRRSTLESTASTDAAAGQHAHSHLHAAAARRVGPGSQADPVHPDALDHQPQQQQLGSPTFTGTSGRMLRWWPFDWLFGKKQGSSQDSSTTTTTGTPSSASTNQTTPGVQPAVVLPSGFFESPHGAPPDPDEELEKLAPPVSFGASLAVRSAVQCVVTKLLADPKAHYTCKHDEQGPVGAPQVGVLRGGVHLECSY